MSLERKRRVLAILVNMVAPYRLPLYQRLANYFNLVIFHEGMEPNRQRWEGCERALHGVRVEQVRGLRLKRRLKGAGIRNFDQRYFDVSPLLIWRLVRLRPDVVISNELGTRTAVALAYSKVFKRPLWVWWGGTLHTEAGIDGIRRTIRRTLIPKVPRWISYGKTSTEYLLAEGVPRERIVQIQNCVDEKLFLQETAPALNLRPRPALLVVGRLVPLKGLAELLHAAAAIQKNGSVFSLTFIGDGPDRGNLEMLVKTLGLRYVNFISEQPPEKMPAIYRSGDCLVFPTLQDVWGLVVNEALWCGLPVLASRYAGCAEELLPPDNIIDPKKPEDLRAGLARAIAGSLSPPDMARLWTCDQVASKIIEDINSTLSQLGKSH